MPLRLCNLWTPIIAKSALLKTTPCSAFSLLICRLSTILWESDLDADPHLYGLGQHTNEPKAEHSRGDVVRFFPYGSSNIIHEGLLLLVISKCPALTVSVHSTRIRAGWPQKFVPIRGRNPDANPDGGARNMKLSNKINAKWRRRREQTPVASRSALRELANATLKPRQCFTTKQR